jgi:hypothetical protein
MIYKCARNWTIYGGITMIFVTATIVGCEPSRQYSDLYQNQTGPLSTDQINAQKWDGFTKQINAAQPVADATGPFTMGIGPLVVSLAGNVAAGVALFYRRRANNANKLPG